MMNVETDAFGVMSANMSLSEFKALGRIFTHEGRTFKLKTACRLPSGFIYITAREADSPEYQDTLAEYPMYTKYSPNRKTFVNIGHIESRRGKRKLKMEDPKPYQPLKGDTDTGLGERRKRYVR